MDPKVGLHITETSGCLKPATSAAYKVFSAFTGDTGKHIWRHAIQLILSPSSILCCRDNFVGQPTSSVCPQIGFLVAYYMANCWLDRGQSVVQSCATQTTSSQFYGSVTSLKQISSSLQLTGIRGGQHVLRVWKVSQQPLSKQPATVMPLLKQLVSGLRVLNVVESAPQTLVCAVIYTSTKDCNDSTRHSRHRRTTASKEASSRPRLSITHLISSHCRYHVRAVYRDVSRDCMGIQSPQRRSLIILN